MRLSAVDSRLSIQNFRRFTALRRRRPIPVKYQGGLVNIFDTISDGVISTDLQARVVRMNRVAQRLTGWPFAEARGRPLSEIYKIVDSESGTTLRIPFAEVKYSNCAINLSKHCKLVALDGRRYMVEGSAKVIREHNSQNASGIVLVFKDVSDKDKLENEFK